MSPAVIANNAESFFRKKTGEVCIAVDMFSQAMDQTNDPLRLFGFPLFGIDIQSIFGLPIEFGFLHGFVLKDLSLG